MKRLAKILGWIVVALIALLALGRALMTPAIEYGLQDWFAGQGIETSVGDIRIDVDGGQFEIADLRGSRDGEALFRLDRLTLGWHWRGVLDNHLVLRSIDIAGVEFSVDADPAAGRLRVAGIDPGGEPVAAPAETPAEAAGKPWSVDIEALNLDDIAVCLRLGQADELCHRLDHLGVRAGARLGPGAVVEAGGEVELAGLRAEQRGEPALRLDRLAFAWQLRQRDGIELALRSLDIGGVEFAVDADPASGRLVVAGLDLGGTASAPAAEPAAPSAAWKFELDGLDLAEVDICLRRGETLDVCNRIDRLGWRGRVEARSDAAVGTIARIDGDLAIAGLSIRHNPLARTALAFDRLAVEGIAGDWPGEQRIAALELAELVLLERAGDEFAGQVSSLGLLKIGEVKLSDLRRLEVARVELRDHRLLYRLLPDGGSELDAWLPAGRADDGATGAGTDAAEGGETFSFALGELRYHGDGSLVFRDDRGQPGFVAELAAIDLTLARLDSREPEQDSRLQLAATYGEHGALALDGSLRPLAEKPSFDLSGTIDGLDLRQLSAFTRGAIGHRIRSGQLDAELTLRAEQALLDSVVALTLNRFEIEALSAEDREKVDASLGLPLGPSLSLLRDRDDRIRLDIPITGDLENPEFDPGDVINTALSKAMTAAVINYYTPFGLVTVAEGIFDFATALRFDPVEFAPGQSALAAGAALEPLATMLRERPGVDLTLCPVSNDADRRALLPDTAETEADALQLDDEQKAQLAALGEIRAGNVKRELVARGIEAGRLVLCEPEHEPGSERPRVEISI